MKFETFIATLTLCTATHSFHRTLQLMMMYHQKRNGGGGWVGGLVAKGSEVHKTEML